MLRAIIIDDELPAIGHLADLLSATGRVEVVAEFINPLEALEKVQALNADVVFLDIEMPGLDGLSLAHRLLELDRSIEIVFVTAFNEYAIAAFELHAQDYLLKPVAKERLLKTINRLKGRTIIHFCHLKLKITCFGKFQVESEQGRIVKWRTAKTEELFAYLVDKDGETLTREIIIEALWRHMGEKQAITNFSTCLYNLKKNLTQLGFPSLLIIEQGLYKLDFSQLDLDVYRFQQSVSLMENITANNITELKKILKAYGEGYFALNYYDWAQGRRAYLDDMYLLLIIHTANYEWRAGNTQQAMYLLRQGLAKDSLHVGLNAAMLKLYLHQKDQIGAVKHYSAYKRRLKKELGLEPDETMSELIK